jgi:hypothetical protein
MSACVRAMMRTLKQQHKTNESSKSAGCFEAEARENKKKREDKNDCTTVASRNVATGAL